jgi:hypothetical protein
MRTFDAPQAVEILRDAHRPDPHSIPRKAMRSPPWGTAERSTPFFTALKPRPWHRPLRIAASSAARITSHRSLGIARHRSAKLRCGRVECTAIP